MRRRDVIACPYAYSYDVFHHCTNPRRAQVPITPFVSTSSIHYMHHTLHHSSLHFLQSPTIFHMSAQQFRLNPVFITPETITWLSFDSIVSPFCSYLHAWPGGTVDSFAFETSPFHHHLSSVLPSARTNYYTNLAHFRLHLFRLHKSNPLTTPAHNVSSTFSTSQTHDDPFLLSLTTSILPLPCSTLCATLISVPIVSFPSSFRSVIGIDFTYHPLLFDSHTL